MSRKKYNFVLKKAKKRKYGLQFKAISDIICEKIEVQDELKWYATDKYLF